jgi:hypothetical protein
MGASDAKDVQAEHVKSTVRSALEGIKWVRQWIVGQRLRLCSY